MAEISHTVFHFETISFICSVVPIPLQQPFPQRVFSLWLGGYFFASQFSELDSFRQRHCFLFLGYLLLEQTVSRRFLANNFVGTDFNLLNLQRQTVAVAVWLAVFKINFYSILDPFPLSPHSAYHVFFCTFSATFFHQFFTTFINFNSSESSFIISLVRTLPLFPEKT